MKSLIYVIAVVLVFVATTIGSSCYFILSATKKEVSSYCYEEIIKDQSEYSQRNVACSLRKYR